MAQADPPETPATVGADRLGVVYEAVQRERSHSVEEAAQKLGVSVDALVKTLVVRRSEETYVLVCLSGSRSIDWSKLRTHLGERRLSMPDAEEALAATGYVRGTITPFGSSGDWPVIVDEPLMDQERVAIGGGAHGVSMLLDPRALVRGLGAAIADVGKTA